MGGEWRPDPTGRHQWRWWDDRWTDFVGDHGATSTDAHKVPTELAVPPAVNPWTEAHRLLQLGGGLLIVVGSLGPWAKVSLGFLSQSVSGTNGDGIITLIAGIGVLVFSFLAMRRPTSRVFIWFVLAGGLIALGIAVYDGFDIQRVADSVDSSFVRASLGWGVVVCGIGGATAIAGVVVELERRRTSGRAARAAG
jgi:hypothetical protein